MFGFLRQIQEKALNYLNSRNVICNAPLARGYEREEREMISGRIIDEQLDIIPATVNQKRLLKYGNFLTEQEAEDSETKVYILRDKNTGQFRGAVSISKQDIEDEDEFEDEIVNDEMSKLYDLDADEDEDEDIVSRDGRTSVDDVEGLDYDESQEDELEDEDEIDQILGIIGDVDEEETEESTSLSSRLKAAIFEEEVDDSEIEDALDEEDEDDEYSDEIVDEILKIIGGDDEEETEESVSLSSKLKSMISEETDELELEDNIDTIEIDDEDEDNMDTIEIDDEDEDEEEDITDEIIDILNSDDEDEEDVAENSLLAKLRETFRQDYTVEDDIDTSDVHDLTDDVDDHEYMNNKIIDILGEEEPESSDSPGRKIIIKYFDVSPDGSCAHRAIQKILKTPYGYAIQSQGIKIVKQPVNEPFIKRFLF